MRDSWTIVDLLHIKIVIDRPSNIRLPAALWILGFFFLRIPLSLMVQGVRNSARGCTRFFVIFLGNEVVECRIKSLKHFNFQDDAAKLMIFDFTAVDHVRQLSKSQ